MTKLSRQNVGGIDYTMVGCTLTGVCASAASDYVKAAVLSDGDILSDGMSVVVTFANGNTAGTAPASLTIYSSDQVNYYSDSGLTQPFTLAPSGCYDIEYTGTGNAYTYQSFPVIQIGNVSAPLCTTDGRPAGGVVWTAGSSVSLLYTLGKFLVLPSARLTPYCTSANTTVSGGPLVSGGSVKIMFTSALTSANTTTALVLNYNGVNIPVKVPRNGSLVDYKASAVGNVNYFCQAYTALELIYDGTNFIIMGNPVIYSDTDTTIYADGLKRVNTLIANSKDMITSGCVYSVTMPVANNALLQFNSGYSIADGSIVLCGNLLTLNICIQRTVTTVTGLENVGTLQKTPYDYLNTFIGVGSRYSVTGVGYVFMSPSAKQLYLDFNGQSCAKLNCVLPVH